MNKRKMLYVLKILLIVVCVSSESVENEDLSAVDEYNLREGRQVNEDSYDGPVDLHDQLQSLVYASGEQKANDEPPHNSWRELVPGTPGTDYPNLNKIPETSFSCSGKTPGGYYADVETGCQVFHICNIGGFKSSFLCPEGSIFNQRYFVCDWWYGFHCDDAVSLYPENQPKDDNTDTSESVDNYEPIEFPNSPTKDLAEASTGEGGPGQRLPKDNQREPLSDEQRNVADHNEKLDRKLRRDYANRDEKFQHYSSQSGENLQPSGLNLDKPELHKETDESSDKSSERYSTLTTDVYFSNAENSYQDTVPRGFAFNRQPPRRNVYRKASQIPGQAQLDGYSNFSGKSEGGGPVDATRDEEIRYVPAL